MTVGTRAVALVPIYSELQGNSQLEADRDLTRL